MPEMIFVDSSNIEAIGYDSDLQELHVQFLTSGNYVYHGVEDWRHQELMQADSKGIYLNAHVKGRYEFSGP